jgi:hypothetical protein
MIFFHKYDKNKQARVPDSKGACAGLYGLHQWLIWGAFLPMLLTSLGNADYMQDDSSDALEITRVIATTIPAMKNDSLLYYLDLVFKELPGKFWSYSDSLNHTATIEILGHEIHAPMVSLPPGSPVSKIQIKNRSTKMDLTGVLGAITFNIKPGWSIEIAQTDSNDIRLIAGKKMEVKEIKEELVKKRR